MPSSPEARGGIGLQAGKLFAQEGAKVLLVDLHENALKEAVQTIGSDAVRYCAADVTQPDHTQQYIQSAVEQFGGVDVLLANAGIEGEVQPITDYAIDTFDQVMAVNVRGVWLGLKYAAPEIAKRGWRQHRHHLFGCRRAWCSRGVGLYCQQTRRDRADAHRSPGNGRQEDSGQYGQSGSGGYPDDAFPGRGL